MIKKPTSPSECPTLSQAMDSYLESISLARSANTARSYRNAMQRFAETLAQHGLPPTQTPVSALPEEAVAWLATALKRHAPASEQMYLTAAKGFYEYLVAENLAEINLPQIRSLIRMRARKPGRRLPQFPRNAIEDVLLFVNNITYSPSDDTNRCLRDLRDRAFLITLADTGLRVHEACALRRGDIDWAEQRAIVIGKGNKQAVVRFSRRAISAIKAYLAARGELDGASRKTLATLPLFARHDPGAGKKVKPISTKTGRMIVKERVAQALGDAAVGTITPHSFRHYFVTMVLKGSGNLKLAQELARHSSVSITQRYAHLSDDELDRGYEETIDRD